jgi:chorismate mutase
MSENNDLKATTLRGVRGATTVEANNASSIKNATKELLTEMLKVNKIETDDIAATFFTTTKDLFDEFPAVAARDMGWKTVPLLCSHEMEVPSGLKKCIRILILWNTEKPQNKIKHPYLKEAVNLRKSQSEFDAT